MSRVDYEGLFPDEFQELMAKVPIGYLPFGTLEWHGSHNVLGADLLIAQGLFRQCAERLGGIVFPPLWLAPDLTKEKDGEVLIGMDFFHETSPNRQLPGSCYWIPDDLFVAILEGIVAQAKRAGFKAILADGHGPARAIWQRNIDRLESTFDIRLLSAIRDFKEGEWKTQTDHAGRNETSLLMALSPEYSDLDKLGPDLVAVLGEDPKGSTREHGQHLIDETINAIKMKFAELGLLPAKGLESA